MFSIVIAPDPLRMSFFRPLSFLLFNFLYKIFNLNFYIWNIFNAFVLAFFAITVYNFFLKLLPNKKRTIYITSLLTILSLPVLYGIWFIPPIDVVGAIFLLLTFLAFINIDDKKKETLVLFLVLLIFTIFLKETLRFHLLIILITHTSFGLVNNKRIKEYQWIGIFIFCFLILIFSDFLIPKNISWEKMPLSLEHTKFIFIHNLTQITHSMPFVGPIILLTSSLLTLIKKSNIAYLGILGLIFLVIIFISPPLIDFSFLGLIVYSHSNLFVLLLISLLFIISLCIKTVKEKFPLNFFSGYILIIFFGTTLVIMFAPFAREDIASYNYISIIPFLLYQLVNSLKIIYKEIKNSQKIESSLLKILLVCSTLMLYKNILSSK
jgi:hypothetical protein